MPASSKLAFITGANKGLGLEAARGLLDLGISVLLASRDLTRGQAAAQTLSPKNGAKVEPIEFDVNNLAHHARLAQHLDQHHNGTLDILINNAAVSLDNVEFGPAGANNTATVSQKVLRETFDTNFFHVVALTQALLPALRKSPAGRIVNLSSSLGSLGLHSDPASPIFNMKPLAYDASKTALNAFTVHLAHALRDTPIKVNSADPGWVQTDMGGPNAPLPLSEGGKTSVHLATLPADGPSGKYFHLDSPLPW